MQRIGKNFFAILLILSWLLFAFSVLQSLYYSVSFYYEYDFNAAIAILNETVNITDLILPVALTIFYYSSYGNHENYPEHTIDTFDGNGESNLEDESDSYEYDSTAE